MSNAADEPFSVELTHRNVRVRNAVILVGMCLIGVMWAAVLGVVGQQRDAAVAQARQDVGNLAIAFEEQAVRTLDIVDQMMLFLKADFERGPSSFNLEHWIRRSPLQPGLALQLALIGADGRLAASSLDPSPKPVDLTDREHFRVHVDHDQGALFIAKPVLGRVSGRWTIQLSRRLNAPGGAFAGVVVASIDPDALTRLYGSIDVGQGGNTTLVGTDGIVRARAVSVAEAAGQGLGESILDSALFKHIEKSPIGTYTSRSSIDGIERVRAYRIVRGYPLIVVVGKSADDILETPRRSAEWIFLVTGGVTTLLVGLIGFLALEIHRRARRERGLATERLKLAASEERLRFALAGANAGIWDWDITGERLEWSPECCRLHAIDPAQGPERFEDWVRLVHLEDRGVWEDAVRHAFDSRSTTLYAEYRVRRTEGGGQWLGIAGRVAYSDTEEPLRVTGLVLGVSERKEAERQLLAGQAGGGTGRHHQGRLPGIDEP